MSNTSHVNIINLEVWAQDDYDKDVAAGTVDNVNKRYEWHSDFQTIPFGIKDNPEGYARMIKYGMPEVNTIRIAFNIHTFNADGSMDSRFERFLAEAANQGLKVIFNLADGDLQGRFPAGTTFDQGKAQLTGELHDRMIQTWDLMLDWLDNHPSVKSSIYGLEALNEPASYGMVGAMKTGGSDEMMRLYGDHMAEVTAMIRDRTDSKVLIDGSGYAQNFNSLAQTTSSDGQTSVLNQIRAAAGDDLVWSSHLYAHWINPALQNEEAISEWMKDNYAVLGNDDILLTETGIPNSQAYTADATDPNMALWLNQSWEVWADAGIGVGVFPGASLGRASMIWMTNNNNSLHLVSPDAYAAGMDMFLTGENDPAHAGNELVTANLRSGVVSVYIDGVKQTNIDGFALGAGYGGNDTIVGVDRAFNMLYGGAGNDLITGKDNRDFLFGHEGNDTLSGGKGNDALSGGKGNDVLNANIGNDFLTGGRGADLFTLEDGGLDVISDMRWYEGDRLRVGGSDVTQAQISANSTLVDYDGDGVVDDVKFTWAQGQVVLLNYDKQRANGIVEGTSGNDTISVGYHDVSGDAVRWSATVIDGKEGNDVINTTSANDTIFGGLGNDTIVAQSGNNSVNGGEGDDKITGWGGNDILIGGAGADSIHGQSGNNSLTGDDGNDTLIGWEGNDTVRGGIGNDSINVGAGENLVYGDAGDDIILGGANDEDLYGGDGNDDIQGKGGHDSIWGGIGDDKITTGSGNDSIRGDAGKDTIAGGDGNNVIVAGSDDDVVYTGKGNDVIYGDAGNDTINGGSGNNKLSGGIGDDSIIGSSGDDYIRGDSGNDSLHGGDGKNDIAGGDGNDTLYAWNGDDLILGGGGDDIINSGNGKDTVNGDAGNDKITAYDGDDSLFGGSGNDTISAGNGNNTVKGDADADVITTGTGNDTVYGGTGNDVINSGTGQDKLYGDAGTDTFNLVLATGSKFDVTGGEDADTFYFTKSTTSGRSDVVLNDYDDAQDVLRIDSLIGLDAIIKSKSFKGFVDTGADVQMTFNDDVYIFKNHEISDLI